MGDYRKDYIEGKIREAGTPVFKIVADGKMVIECGGGFEFEVVPVMARSLSYINKETNELTTITKSSISVKQLRQQVAPQLPIPGVGDGR